MLSWGDYVRDAYGDVVIHIGRQREVVGSRCEVRMKQCKSNIIVFTYCSPQYMLKRLRENNIVLKPNDISIKDADDQTCRFYA